MLYLFGNFRLSINMKCYILPIHLQLLNTFFAQRFRRHHCNMYPPYIRKLPPRVPPPDNNLPLSFPPRSPRLNCLQEKTPTRKSQRAFHFLPQPDISRNFTPPYPLRHKPNRVLPRTISSRSGNRLSSSPLRRYPSPCVDIARLRPGSFQRPMPCIE